MLTVRACLQWTKRETSHVIASVSDSNPESFYPLDSICKCYAPLRLYGMWKQKFNFLKAITKPSRLFFYLNACESSVEKLSTGVE